MPTSRRDIVVTLLDRHPTAQPRSAGIRVRRSTRNERFLLLGLSALYADKRDLAVATAAIRELRGRRLDTPNAIARASLRQLTSALVTAGYGAGSGSAAGKLRTLSRAVREEYGGDLERLRAKAKRDPVQERRLLKGFRAIGDVAVDLFFQHTQEAWRELFPFLAPRAIHAATTLGLPADVKSLTKISSGQLTELGASLVQTHSEKDYLKVLAKARGEHAAAIRHPGPPSIKPAVPREPSLADVIARRKQGGSSGDRSTRTRATMTMAKKAPKGRTSSQKQSSVRRPEGRGQWPKPPPRALTANGGGGTGSPAEAPTANILTLPDLGLASGGESLLRRQGTAPAGPPAGHALLRTPPTAVVGEFFRVTFGLAKSRAESGAETGRLELPKWVTGDYTIEVELVAPGFDVEEGKSLFNELPVTWAKWDPMSALRLKPRAQDDALYTRTISATFVVDGQVLAMIERPITVGRSAGDLGAISPPRSRSVVEQVTPADMLDLTVVIQQVEPSSPGKLLWRYYTPHRGRVNLPGNESKDIGQDARSFANDLMQDVGGYEGEDGLHALLRTRGKRIAKSMPHSFWRLFREIAAYVKRPPSILFMSQEPYVPWELAVVPDPLPDPKIRLPFLCAQAVTGRWLFGGPPPRPAQASDIDVSSMVVVSAVYWGPDLKRLRRAEEEAACLQALYGAAPVDARRSKVISAIRGRPPAQVLHFSVHGRFDPSDQNGLLFPRPKPRKGASDDTSYEILSPDVVEDIKMRGSPFVFLNACQVGRSAQMLGDYTGMAAAFVKAGASGVVAPLWSVQDEIAKDVALRFYEEIIASKGRKAPAEIFREQRLRFGPKQRSGTYLAYQFFGHPGTKINLTKDRKEAPDGCAGTARPSRRMGSRR